MRVAKSNQLRRLLQTQDVLLSVLVAAICIDIFWFLGFFDVSNATNYLKLLGFVGIFSGVASLTHYPRLHDQSLLHFSYYAIRYTLMVLAGISIIFWLSGIYWTNASLVVCYFIGTILTLLINRVFLRWWYLEGRREHRANHIKVIVIGTGPRAQKLVKAYHANVDWTIDVIACVDPEEHAHFEMKHNNTIIRGLASFDKLLATEIVDEVVICLPRSMLGQINPVIAACEEQGVCIKFMADFYDVEVDRFSMEQVGNLPMLNVEPVMVGTGQWVTKRLIDLTLTILLLAFVWPLLIILAIAIKLDSPGSIFFVQTRVGLNKRPFQMIKFRSMYTDAEKSMEDLAHLNEATGPIFKIENDPRITRIGRILRKFSIDEIPQLINVIMGHMSLVGPRPMSLRDVSRFDHGTQQRRFSVRPGLACLREIEGRSKLSFDRWLELDLQYIDSWSFALDLKILFKLIPVVIRGKGAS